MVTAHRRAAQNMPAAWRLQTLDARLHTADHHSASRGHQTRLVAAGWGNGLIQAAKIGITRHIAQHIDPIITGDMTAHHLIRCQIFPFGDLFEIKTEFPAIADRHTPTAWRGRFGPRSGRELFKMGAQGSEG